MAAGQPGHGPGQNFGLDLVRSAAILLVLFSHTAAWWFGTGQAAEIGAAYMGRIGVEAFFSLSGFLIGGILLRALDAGLDRPALLRFWCRRWLRTLPAYWVVIGLLCWHFGVVDWRSPLFLQNFVPRAAWTPLTPHTWSLSLEEWFYLFVPPLLMAAAALLRRRRDWRRWTVPLVCGALVMACTLGRWSAGLAPSPVWGPEPLVNPVLRLDCAAWGLMAAWLVRGRPLPSWAAWGLLGAGGAALALLGWVWAGMFEPARLIPWGFRLWGAAWVPLHPALEEAASACIVLALHRLLPRGRPALAWAAGGTAALSYSLYLVHVPVLYLMRGAGLDDASDWGVRGAMAAAVAAAALALRWGVERPALALRERLAPERHGSAAPGPRQVGAAPQSGRTGPADGLNGFIWQGRPGLGIQRLPSWAGLHSHLGSAAAMQRPDFGAPHRAAAWAASPQALPAVFAVFAALLVARNPAVLLHAEFWAEDGWLWYPGAYTSGLRAFIIPVAGYLQTLPRMVAWLVQPFPLAWAPTLFAVAALLIQVLPPLLLVSPRMADAWPDARGRMLFALLWLALPNTREVYVNLTNSQWHLAALAFLVLLSRPPFRPAARGLDGAVLLLSGVSGPFCLVLAPVAAWLAWVRRDRVSLLRAAAVLAAAAVQAACVVATIHERAPALLGAGPRLLARIVSLQVVFGALVGQRNMPLVTAAAGWEGNLLPVAASVAAAALAAAAVLRGSPALRLAVLSATVLLAAALTRPQITLDGPQWLFMQSPGVGQRYYYFPMLAWLAALFGLAGSGIRWRRTAGRVLLGCAAIGVWSDWRILPLAPTGFAAQARTFDAAPPGTQMEFQFHPVFDKAPMRLTKR